MEVDPELRAVLEAAHEAGAATGGAFDVTVGPLIELWVEAAHGDKLPTEAALSAARRRVGVSRLRIEPGGRVSLGPGTTIDLGGIAKGFALDRIAAELRAAGFDRGLLSFGQSSIQALGRPPDAPGWRLLLRSPDEDFGGLVLLEDQALSVSSTLGQWSEVEGRRYGHVIDPRSGRPIERGRQAAVVAATAAEAEVLSTALVVLDESDGVDLVESTPGAEAFVLDEEGFAFASSGWSRATRFERLDRSPAD